MIYYDSTPSSDGIYWADWQREYVERWMKERFVNPNPNPTGDVMKTYIGLIILKPTTAEAEEGAKPQIVVPLDTYIAANEDSVKYQMMQKIDKKIDGDRLLYKIATPFH